MSWVLSGVMIINLALFLWAAHLYYTQTISIRTFYGFKALFYLLLILTTGVIKADPPPPPLLMYAILFCFLKDLFFFIQPLRWEP